MGRGDSALGILGVASGNRGSVCGRHRGQFWCLFGLSDDNASRIVAAGPDRGSRGARDYSTESTF